MRDSLTIVLSGEAGQGLATIEEFLVEAISKEYHVFTSKEVMSRVRGGNNTVEIRIAKDPVEALRYGIDYLFLLNNHSFYRLTKRVTDKTVVFTEDSFVSDEELGKLKATRHPLNLSELAKQAGNRIFANTILFGYIAGMLELTKESCHELIAARFASKGDKIIAENHNAFNLGFDLGKAYVLPKKVGKPTSIPAYKVMDGNTAIGIGTLAGGVNFIASYPMSPGTSLLVYLAEKGKEFNVLVEQAEDEIAALNMVVGAWYAGARAIATTSGGGFALMTEAVSLAGITETPAVIHVAQRPGPATGLPTRTEQADLNLVVYAGHGEFPRIVLAPGKLEDGVHLAQRAFWLADKYQVPVFLLTDQYYLESFAQVIPFEIDDRYLESFVVKTDVDYKRYAFDPSGISPRGIPGNGLGFVKSDSDEHDEAGQITEDFDVRVAMNDKRLHKRSLLLADYVDEELIGPKDYTNLLVGWGSTYGVIKEFIESGDSKNTAFLHIRQPFPLHPKLKKYFDQSKNTIVIENNATGQFANLCKLELDVKIHSSILKYNGEPFSIEEITQRVTEAIR